MIPMRDLYAFMTELKKELPGVAEVPEYLQKRQVTLSAQKLGLFEHQPLQVIITVVHILACLKC